MPGIDDDLLDCAVYFYSSVEAAKEGHQSGGCGFLLGVPSDATFPVPGRQQPVGIWCLHAVTNKHVIDAGCRVARVGGQDGTPAIWETSPDDWFLALDDDLAVQK